MKQFTRLEDIESAPLAQGVLIEHILKAELTIANTTILDPDDGAIYLLDESDTDEVLIESFGQSFPTILFECIQHVVAADSYICRLLRDNERVITFVLPDRAWIPKSWRTVIQEVVS